MMKITQSGVTSLLLSLAVSHSVYSGIVSQGSRHFHASECNEEQRKISAAALSVLNVCIVCITQKYLPTAITSLFWPTSSSNRLQLVSGVFFSELSAVRKSGAAVIPSLSFNITMTTEGSAQFGQLLFIKEHELTSCWCEQSLSFSCSSIVDLSHVCFIVFPETHNSDAVTNRPNESSLFFQVLMFSSRLTSSESLGFDNYCFNLELKLPEKLLYQAFSSLHTIF